MKHNKQKVSTKEGRSAKTILVGLNMFNCTKLILSSDVDQDTKMFGSHENVLALNILLNLLSDLFLF